MGYNSGLASTQTVNLLGGSTNLPTPALGQTLVSVNAGGVSNNTTLYTVPAGKTFYCLGATMAYYGGGAVGVKIGATIKLQSTSGADGNGSSTGTGGIPFTAAANDVITTYTNGGGALWYGSIWGYLQ
jgi:hypothetical protein